MIELDPYFFFWVSRELHQCLIGLGSQPPSLPPVFSGRHALEQFVTSWNKDFLPKSKEKAKEIISLIDALVPSIQEHGHLVISTNEYAYIHAAVMELEEHIQEECKHLYVLCVENQRLMSAYVLVEKIENACSPKTWKYMSALARREIEESGKSLAVERYTASGFHILRCVEAIAKEYLVALPNLTLAPSDRNWGKYSEILGKNGAASEVTSILDSIRKDDRNTLMHPEKFLNQDEAIGLFNLCLTALDRLINDMERRGFAKPFTP